MKILVTGAAGFIGAALCPLLASRGHSVRAVIRRSGKAGAPRPDLEYAAVPDLAGEFDRRILVEGIDVVVHLAGIAHRSAGDSEIRRVNVEATARLAEAASASVRRFVFLSSVKALGEDSGAESYSESAAPRPEDDYGRSKLEAEAGLAEISARTGMELVLVRPPLVYGPGVKANFLRLMHWVDSGRPLPLAAVRNRRSLVFLGNLADAIARCAEHPDARGPFLVSDEEAVSTAELAVRIARALGRRPRLFAIPPVLLKLAGAALGRTGEIRQLTGNLVVDAGRMRRVLGWRPPHTLGQGLEETVRWYRSSRG